MKITPRIEALIGESWRALAEAEGHRPRLPQMPTPNTPGRTRSEYARVMHQKAIAFIVANPGCRTKDIRAAMSLDERGTNVLVEGLLASGDVAYDLVRERGNPRRCYRVVQR